ncbi:hypothetical protein Q8A73_001740 [Channa argus]|nr:hypothetical protein Q8A73_001740 [Channa argus]
MKPPFCPTLEIRVLHKSVRVRSAASIRSRAFHTDKVEKVFREKSGYLERGGGGGFCWGWGSQRASWFGADLVERRVVMMMMMMMLNHGAHFCAPPVHREETRPSPFSGSLITDSFESRHRVGGKKRSPGFIQVDNSTPSPAHADEPA